MVYVFGEYSLDPVRRELRRGADAIVVEPGVFDLLEYLIRNRDRVVSKDDLIATVWNGRIVSESALASRMSAARDAVGDSGEKQFLIRTIARRGHRFVGEVREEEPVHSSAPQSEQTTPYVPAGPDKPVVAVLPFHNMSGDPEQEYFADGMVEDIITGLSRIRSLSVISRNSSFIYKNKPVAVKEVAHTLGVRYVLEGSVRKSGNRVRITAQLIDAEADAHIWAERYDRLLEDVFVMQDDIAMCVVGAIEPSLRKAEIDRVKRQRPSHLGAYDLVLRSLPFVYAQMPKEIAIAIPLLEDALKIEPNYGGAHAFLSWCLHARFARGGQREEDRVAAVRHARLAIEHGSDDATALAIAAFVLALNTREISTALKLFDRALELSNSNVFAYGFSSWILASVRKNELAVERARRVPQLSPFDIMNFTANCALACVYFNNQRYEEAANAARSAIDVRPGFSLSHAILAAAFLRLGNMEAAQAAAQATLVHEPSFTIAGTLRYVELDPMAFTSLAEAWREVGLPE